MDEDEKEQSIPEEIAADQRLIPFEGDELAAAQTSAGDVYVSLNGICQALGLTTRAQVLRIQRTPSLAKGLRRIQLETGGGLQRVNCLRVDRIALWLAGMETSRVKPEYRGKIESYQDELAPLAFRLFSRMMGMAPAPATDTRLAELSTQMDALISLALDLHDQRHALTTIPGQMDALGLQIDDAIAMLEALTERQDTTEQDVKHLQHKTRGLTPGQARAVQEAISSMVDAAAAAGAMLAYATIYGRIRYHFRVSSYKFVPEERFEELMQFLRDERQRIDGGETLGQGNLF